MEEKKSINFALSGVLFVISLIIIAILGYFVYTINLEKNEAKNTVNTLTSERDNLQSSVNTLQSKLDEISQEENNQIITENCKTVLQKYLHFMFLVDGAPENLLYELNLISEADYTKLQDSASTADYIKTSIPFDNFKNEILKYQTEEMFEKDFTSQKDQHLPLFKNEDGLLSVLNGAGGSQEYNVEEMTLITNTDNTYTFEAKYSQTFESAKETGKITATFISSNGNYLISSIVY